MDTRGTRRPARPRERREGTGTAIKAARPMVTAVPETTTVCPAVASVVLTAWVTVGARGGPALEHALEPRFPSAGSPERGAPAMRPR
jgi:hypothetical protein